MKTKQQQQRKKRDKHKQQTVKSGSRKGVNKKDKEKIERLRLPTKTECRQTHRQQPSLLLCLSMSISESVALGKRHPELIITYNIIKEKMEKKSFEGKVEKKTATIDTIIKTHTHNIYSCNIRSGIASLR